MSVQQGILSLNIADKEELYKLYMAFVKNGGLFVPSGKTHSLGDDVFVLVTLEDINEKLPFSGKVVWITPQGAQGNRRAGVGVQFSGSADGASARKVIEAHLAGLMKRTSRTETL